MINNVVLNGRITKDPVVAVTNNDKNIYVVNFVLAVNERPRKDKDGKKIENTNFIPCVAWNTTAELIGKYVKKGHLIGVVGMVKTGKYQDENDKTVYTMKILVNQLQFLNSSLKKDQNNNQPLNYPDDEMPF